MNTTADGRHNDELRALEILAAPHKHTGQTRKEAVAVLRAALASPATAPRVDEAAALAEFTDYFVRNYPGPNTIIGDPNWHAPRIFRAAQRALQSAAPVQGAVDWQPIETAPKDNKRPLYLARFNDKGELVELDFDGSWESESESWELPQVYYYWASASGIEEPTHWAYQDSTPPTGGPA